MKPQLVIHIGTHKTATSTIQFALDANRADLRDKGILFAATNRMPFPDLPKHTSLGTALRLGPKAFQVEFEAIMEEFTASGCSTLVLTEEGFSSPNFEKFNFHFFKQFLPHFNIRTVCFLRRQDSFIESLWNQFTKHHRQTDDIIAFLNLPKNRQRLDYVRFLDFWAGFSEVKAVGYEIAVKKGIEQAFTEASGIPLPISQSPRNVSPGVNCAIAMTILNRLGVSYDTKQLIAAFSNDKSKHVLGSIQRHRLLADMAEHNARLAKSYGVIFPDTMPEEAPDPILLPDINEVLLALAKVTKDKAAAKLARTMPAAKVGVLTKGTRRSEQRKVKPAAQ